MTPIIAAIAGIQHRRPLRCIRPPEGTTDVTPHSETYACKHHHPDALSPRIKPACPGNAAHLLPRIDAPAHLRQISVVNPVLHCGRGSAAGERALEDAAAADASWRGFFARSSARCAVQRQGTRLSSRPAAAQRAPSAEETRRLPPPMRPLVERLRTPAPSPSRGRICRTFCSPLKAPTFFSDQPTSLRRHENPGAAAGRSGSSGSMRLASGTGQRCRRSVRLPAHLPESRPSSRPRAACRALGHFPPRAAGCEDRMARSGSMARWVEDLIEACAS